jgi:hypothetical protein
MRDFATALRKESEPLTTIHDLRTINSMVNDLAEQLIHFWEGQFDSLDTYLLARLEEEQDTDDPSITP